MWILPPVLFLFSVNALDNGLARTPPMGWMSWAAFMCETDCDKYPFACINENLYQDMADVMVEHGYRDAGYNSIHVDDCWMAMERDSNGRLIANKTRFPHGIDGLAKYMHDRQLTFGIYEDFGTETCAGYPGSKGFIKTDAQTFANWNCDYLKFDGCNSDPAEGIIGYPAMASALNATGKKIIYSCEWPLYLWVAKKNIDYAKVAATCNLWRNYDDVANSWKSIASIIMHYYHQQDDLIEYHGPGQWNDPDMIVAGNPGVTWDQSMVQLTVWSIWSAPLILSADLRTTTAEYRTLFLNRDMIAVNQDPLGKMGKVVLILGNEKVFVYVKQITPIVNRNYSYAFAVVNLSTKHKKSVKFSLSDLDMWNENGYSVKNIWTGEDLGTMKPDDVMRIHSMSPTSCLFFKATANL